MCLIFIAKNQSWSWSSFENYWTAVQILLNKEVINSKLIKRVFNLAQLINKCWIILLSYFAKLLLSLSTILYLASNSFYSFDLDSDHLAKRVLKVTFEPVENSSLLVILSLNIINSLHQDNKNNELRHNDALVKLLKSCNKKTQHAMHEMIEIKHWFKDNVKNLCLLEASRFFHLHTILRSVHVVSVNDSHSESNKNKFFYINNFNDWNSYNLIYKKNFLHKEMRIAKYYFKCESWRYLKLIQSHCRQKSNNVYVLCLCLRTFTESLKSTMLHD